MVTKKNSKGTWSIIMLSSSLFSFLFLLFIVDWNLPAQAQQSGTRSAAGLEVKYTITGATVTNATEDGWIYSMKGKLNPSGTLGVSGAVGMGSGYYADAVVTVRAGNQEKKWTESIPTGAPKVNWKSFNVSVNIPPGATTGSVKIEMTGFYNAGDRGLKVLADLSSTETIDHEVPAPFKPWPMPTATPSVRDKYPDSGVRFSGITGQVEWRPEDDEEGWRPCKLETILPVNAHIRSQEDSSAIISCADMSTFILKPDTERHRPCSAPL